MSSMRRRYREDNDDRCSYISRISEPTPESQFECLITSAVAILILAIVTLLSGCSSCYVAVLRSEYSDNGKIHGIYFGEEEYPAIYPATKIAVKVEMPRWWLPGMLRQQEEYRLLLWPFGMVLSTADIPLSIATDTIMLPYDLTNTALSEIPKEP